MEVVSADWLDTRRESVRIIDVREPWEFDSIGHIPGAVNVPYDAIRADEHGAESTGTGMLPGAGVFADHMGAAGVATDDDIVAYDDHHGVFAARLLVTAELYGHPPERLFLLDGDFSAWQRAHETTTSATPPTAVSYQVTEPADSPLVDIAAVAAAMDDSETVIVDTREDWEFAEGHIPGSIRLDWRELVDDDTRGIHPREVLESHLAERGIVRDRRILLYCNTARRISHTYVVLRHLGYPDLAFYEGSLTEWQAAGRPVETGTE